MSESATASPVATGRLDEQKDGTITLSVPGTDYRLHLAVDAPLSAAIGDRISGTIRANARRVDVVPSGGRFVEPVIGRPRRVQGRIIAGDVETNTITVHAGVPLVARLTDHRQKTSQFALGQLVSFDIERGAVFEPI